MWESLDRFTAEELNMDVVEVGAKRSKKHLHLVATRFVELGYPRSLAVAMFSKAVRIVGATSDNTCSACGLNKLLPNSFTLRQHFVKGERILKAECSGCGSKTSCGKMPAFEIDLNTEDVPVATTRTAAAVDVLQKSITTSSPLLKTPKVVSLQNSNKAKKRRGSALQRLLQEDESESDRSLSGFLSQFGSQ